MAAWNPRIVSAWRHGAHHQNSAESTARRPIQEKGSRRKKPTPDQKEDQRNEEERFT
jgi:hypothetical protein